MENAQKTASFFVQNLKIIEKRKNPLVFTVVLCYNIRTLKFCIGNPLQFSYFSGIADPTPKERMVTD